MDDREVLGSAFILAAPINSTSREQGWWANLLLPDTPNLCAQLGPFGTETEAVAAFGKWAKQRRLYTGPYTAMRTIEVRRRSDSRVT